MNERTRQNYLFNVDILIEGTSNGQALEQLLHVLNTAPIKDYNIRKGIELGKVISMIQGGTGTAPQSVNPSGSPAVNGGFSESARKDTHGGNETESNRIFDMINRLKAENKLVRMSVLQNKGTRKSIPCRILSLDTQANRVIVYHVDEKKVYQYLLQEIEDLSVI